MDEKSAEEAFRRISKALGAEREVQPTATGWDMLAQFVETRLVYDRGLLAYAVEHTLPGAILAPVIAKLHPAPTAFSLDVAVAESMWLHDSGGIYKIVVVARESTNGPHEGEERIVYASQTTGETYVCDAAEFLDGRFTPVEAAGGGAKK